MAPRDITRRRDHAALAAADDHGLVAQLRRIALLDRGVESVAIDVRESEGRELRMRDVSRAATASAAPSVRLSQREAIAAERRHGRHPCARAPKQGRRINRIGACGTLTSREKSISENRLRASDLNRL